MTSDPAPHPEPDDKTPPTPISFKVLVALTVVYLGWRLVQGIMWLVHHLL